MAQDAHGDVLEQRSSAYTTVTSSFNKSLSCWYTVFLLDIQKKKNPENWVSIISFGKRIQKLRRVLGILLGLR